MKRKLLPLLFAILLVFSICMLTACDLSGITGTPQGPADNAEEPKDPDDNNAATEHEHKLVNHKAVPPSCIVEGNIEYWSCSICGKYFIDANGVNETTQISINKTDHLYDSDDCCIICKHDKYTKGLSYSISSDKTYYSVTGIGSAKVKDIAIPPTYQGLPVVRIGERAFYNCGGLTSVTIPDSITSIGNNAFACCYKLVEVYNKSSLTITKGSYNNGYVGLYALNVYTDTNIPSKVHHRDDGYIFYADGDTVYLLGYNGNDTELTLPENYNGKNYEIYQYAFYNCGGVTSITIPDSITSIGYYAFGGCSSLISVTIPNRVTSIGDAAFSGCTSLNAVYITDIVKWCAIDFGNSYSNSYSNPLYYAKNLYLNDELVTDLVIPDGVTRIDFSAFSGCSSLTSVNIPDSVTSVGNRAFSGCSSLTSVTIPDSVTSIGYYAFGDCTSLNAVCITDIAKWCAIDFGNSYSNPLYYAKNLYLNGELLTDLVIPEGVTNIGNYALYDCDSLTSVAIPDSVTIICDSAFEGCYSLTSVTIPDSVTIICDSAFKGCYSLTDVYFTGTEDEWNRIRIGYDNTYLTNATIHFNYVPED